MRQTIATFTILAAILAFTGVRAETRNFVPQAGFSEPIGAVADVWHTGYGLSLEHHRPGSIWGIRVSFHRWMPDADELLQMGSREFKVELNEGWSVMGELSALARYEVTLIPGDLGSVWIEGGAGLFYLRRSDVAVKGYCPDGTTALVRQVYMDSHGEVAPGISAEV